MTETLSAVVSGIVLVLLSMVGGGITYVVAKDYVKRNLRNKE
jgi:uncharacterized membrane-anchored protein